MSALFDAIRRADHNGRQRPTEPDDWSEAFKRATPTAQAAMAAGARSRAMKAEARVAELEAAAQPEPEPDPKADFRSKNHQLLGRLIGRPNTPNQETK